MSDYASLAGAAGTLTFMMSPDWKPFIPEVGQMWSPIGNAFMTKSTIGTKGVGGTLTILTIGDTADHLCEALLKETGVLTLTMPNGDSYSITWDPVTPRTGAKPFALMANPSIQPMNVWTAKYYQAA
jgi:hypothetical protein